MERSEKLYSNLFAAFFLALLMPYGGVAINSLALLYSLWLLSKLDALYFPALIVIGSYLSSAYFIYFFIIILSIQNYKKIQKCKMHKVFVILLALLPFVIFYIGYNILFEGMKFGLAVNQFQLYLPIFGFFYGILISKTIDNISIKGIIFTIFSITLFDYISSNFLGHVQIRLVFYIIPFLFSYIFHQFFRKLKKHNFYYLAFALIYIVGTLGFSQLTFTIMLVILLSFILIALLYMKKTGVIRILTGLPLFIVLFILLGLAIEENKNGYVSSSDLVKMDDVESFDDITERFKNKLYDDRGTIWASVWYASLSNIHWLPPINRTKIILEKDRGSDIVFDYHSHNIYLEILRENGLLFAISLLIILLYLAIVSSNYFLLPFRDSNFELLFIVAQTNFLIGGMTGVYVLLPSYAILGVTIMGVAYEQSNAAVQNHS